MYIFIFMMNMFFFDRSKKLINDSFMILMVYIIVNCVALSCLFNLMICIIVNCVVLSCLFKVIWYVFSVGNI
jgi:hypothetical protein